jgi:glycosyltransferase involved in cell wall biosynthesis
MMDHTFVIPAYKDSPHLEACIRALKAQNQPTNLLIATSTPSAYIQSVAAKHDVPYFVSPRPGGIGNDWNFAINKASTRYVTVAHQDDIYHPDYTHEIMAAISNYQHTKPLIAFCGYIDMVNGVERKRSLNATVKDLLLFPFYVKGAITSKFVKKAVLSLGDPICCPSVTIDRVNTGDMRFSEEYSCVLDWAAWLQLARTEGSFVFVNKKLVKHRIHIESETTYQIQNGKRRQEEFEILSGIWGDNIAKLLSKLYAKGYGDNNV